MTQETAMTESLTDRFDEIARAKLAAVQEAYGRMETAPAESTDRAVAQRHTAFRAMLAHIGLLQKMLGLRRGPAAATPAYTSEGLAALLAAVRAEAQEARDD